VPGCILLYFFFQAEDGIRDRDVTGVQTCALPISLGDIGYVKGIHTALDEIEAGNALYAPFCAELRSLVERFRLPEYMNRLKELRYDDV